ncbi:MAG: hypothetical protein EOM69_12090, partial [Clostridia bacterium]|nr:hypothetical protein [Clostridia bacterium]
MPDRWAAHYKPRRCSLPACAVGAAETRTRADQSALGQGWRKRDPPACTARNPHAPRESWDFTALSIEVCKLCCRQPKPLFTAEEQKKFSIGEIKTRLYEYSGTVYTETEERLKSTEVDMRENERVILLRTVDEHWMDHIDAMDQLKQGIGLRSYAQSDPVYAYT